MTNQTDEGLIKLDKAQRQVREGLSELSNTPAAIIDLANSGLGAGAKALGANDATVKAVESPLNIVTGFTQMITTSFDGKEGSTKKAANKFLSGITFGLCGNEDEKPAEAPKAEAKLVAPKAEVSKADEIKKYDALVANFKKNGFDDNYNEMYELSQKYGFITPDAAFEEKDKPEMF